MTCSASKANQLLALLLGGDETRCKTGKTHLQVHWLNELARRRFVESCEDALRDGIAGAVERLSRNERRLEREGRKERSEGQGTTDLRAVGERLSEEDDRQ